MQWADRGEVPGGGGATHRPVRLLRHREASMNPPHHYAPGSPLFSFRTLLDLLVLSRTRAPRSRRFPLSLPSSMYSTDRSVGTASSPAISLSSLPQPHPPHPDPPGQTRLRWSMPTALHCPQPPERRARS